MDSKRRNTLRPPWPLRVLVRLLIRGRHAAYIASDLETSYRRDLERGFGRFNTTRRYTSNVLASIWSVWANGVRELMTSGIGLDFRLGLRMLVKQRLVTVVAGLTLALGIPASLLLVHGTRILYSDLPVEDGDRLVGIRHFDVASQRPLVSSIHDYEVWADLASFESVAAVRSYNVNITSEGAAGPPVLAAELTASSFDLLRARPLLGRVLDSEDELEGATNVAVIGERLWRDRFSSDPEVVGTTIRLGRTLHTVVGVMPEDFGFPVANEVWLPLRAQAINYVAGAGPRVFVLGRLTDGVTIEDAKIEAAGVLARRASEDPDRFDQRTSEVVGATTLLLNDPDEMWVHPDVLLVQVMIFGLLIVVCGNIGTLFLARTVARSGEITIRTALGASRFRILTQLFVEALVLAIGATGIGLVITNMLLVRMGRLFAAFDHTFGYWWVDFALTPGIIAAALGLAAVCAAVVGVLPALATTRESIQANLQSAASQSSSVRFGIGPSFLIVAEIALSVGFLALGATAVWSAMDSQNRELGLDPDRYVVTSFLMPALDPTDSPSAADSAAWNSRLEEAQRTLLAELAEDPAVGAVAMGRHVPGIKPTNRGVILETPPVGFEPVDRDILIPRVDVSFFEGLNQPIIAGRDFGPGDVDGPSDRHRPAVIVNESFVRDVLGDRNALGQRFRYRPQFTTWPQLEDGEWFEIVGVVESLGTNPQNMAWDAAIYHPMAAGEANPVRYAVEVAGDPSAFLSRLRQIATSVDPEATVDPAVLSTSIRTESLMQQVSFLGMVGIAALTFLLSATGLYSLMSFTVSQRTREIGIRASLGARTIDIAAVVGRRAMLQIGLGLTLGVGFGWYILTQGRWGFDLSNVPLTLALTASIAGAIGVAACARPALRGIRIAPTEALRDS